MPEEKKSENFGTDQTTLEPTPQSFYNDEGQINNPDIAHDIANVGQIAAREAYDNTTEQAEATQKALYETEQSMDPQEAQNYEVVKMLHTKYPNACQVHAGTEEHPTELLLSLYYGYDKNYIDVLNRASSSDTQSLEDTNTGKDTTTLETEADLEQLKIEIEHYQFDNESMKNILKRVTEGHPVLLSQKGIVTHDAHGKQTLSDSVLLGFSKNDVLEFNKTVDLLEKATSHKIEIEKQRNAAKVNTLDDLKSILG